MPGNRKSIRLAGYDYTSDGAYFVTICTKNRECILSKIHQRVGAELASALCSKTSALCSKTSALCSKTSALHSKTLARSTELYCRHTRLGEIVERTCLSLSSRFGQVHTDEYVIMPNHFHGIVMLTNRTRAEASSAPTLGAVIQTFKSICATDYLKQIRKYHLQEIARFWQKNYYERIIRNDDELSRMREYISQNPMHWNKDRYNP